MTSFDNYLGIVCEDVTNSWLDDELPENGLTFYEIKVILSKETLQTNFSFLLQRKWNLDNCEPSLFGDLIYKHLNYNYTQRST